MHSQCDTRVDGWSVACSWWGSLVTAVRYCASLSALSQAGEDRKGVRRAENVFVINWPANTDRAAVATDSPTPHLPARQMLCLLMYTLSAVRWQ